MKPKNKPGYRWVQINPMCKPPHLIEVPEKDFFSVGYTKQELSTGIHTLCSWPPPKTSNIVIMKTPTNTGNERMHPMYCYDIPPEDLNGEPRGKAIKPDDLSRMAEAPDPTQPDTTS